MLEIWPLSLTGHIFFSQSALGPFSSQHSDNLAPPQTPRRPYLAANNSPTVRHSSSSPPMGSSPTRMESPVTPFTSLLSTPAVYRGTRVRATHAYPIFGKVYGAGRGKGDWGDHFIIAAFMLMLTLYWARCGPHKTASSSDRHRASRNSSLSKGIAQYHQPSTASLYFYLDINLWFRAV